MPQGWIPEHSWQLGVLLNGLMVCLLTTGCASLAPEKPTVEAEVAQPDSRGSYVVEFKTSGQTPKVQNFALVGQPTIQDALEQAGALKHFSSIDITLVRTIPGQQGRHKMEVEFDQKRDKVRPDQDYALHPNDHLIIKQAFSNPFDSLLESPLEMFSTPR